MQSTQRCFESHVISIPHEQQIPQSSSESKSQLLTKDYFYQTIHRVYLLNFFLNQNATINVNLEKIYLL
jgi:hypothetical protein